MWNIYTFKNVTPFIYDDWCLKNVSQTYYMLKPFSNLVNPLSKLEIAHLDQSPSRLKSVFDSHTTHRRPSVLAFPHLHVSTSDVSPLCQRHTHVFSSGINHSINIILWFFHQIFKLSVLCFYMLFFITNNGTKFQHVFENVWLFLWDSCWKI